MNPPDDATASVESAEDVDVTIAETVLRVATERDSEVIVVVDECVVVHGPSCSSLTSRVNRCSADAAAPEPPLPVAREELRVGDEEQAGDEEHGQAQHAQKSGCRPVEPEHEHEPGHKARHEHPAQRPPAHDVSERPDRRPVTAIR
jgi:hypothetical protein